MTPRQWLAIAAIVCFVVAVFGLTSVAPLTLVAVGGLLSAIAILVP